MSMIVRWSKAIAFRRFIFASCLGIVCDSVGMDYTSNSNLSGLLLIRCHTVPLAEKIVLERLILCGYARLSKTIAIVTQSY